MERIIEEIREDLNRRVAVAAQRLADRLPTEEPAYAALLGRAALRDRLHEILRQAVEGVAGASRGLPPDLADARSEGALRAGQGLPLDSLLRVYRLGGRLLWQTLTEAVAAHDRAALPRLLPEAPALWDVVDRMADAAAQSYRRAETLREERERELRAAHLDALLDGAGPAEATAESAHRLGLAERGRFAVVALGPGGNADARPAFGAPRVLWRIRADGETGLVDLGHLPLESVRDALAPLGVRAGVSPVVAAPAELAVARRLAVLALRAAPAAEGPHTTLLDERLPAALVAAEPELAGRLRQVVLGPVLALAPQDRHVLLTTLGTWLTCQGSTTYAAQRLYCHRNTVSNRLRRLEQLTGRSLSDPAHVVELALAHTAVTQRSATPASAPPPAPAPAVRRTSPTPGGTGRR
ncbi:helix-turn-helix domain-containing protein [Streptomyces sp. NPDC060048]|uniref:helix-turn-helix domain-containing protein n=1 Tax=unclassified Streptomyces TaxID=2593676 RepID=UPI0036BF3ABE